MLPQHRVARIPAGTAVRVHWAVDQQATPHICMHADMHAACCILQLSAAQLAVFKFNRAFARTSKA